MTEDWRQNAACLTYPVDVFFPVRGDHRGITEALAVCAGCDVVNECLAANIRERDGIFGGTTSRQRRSMQSPRTVSCLQCGNKFMTQTSRALCSEECQTLRHSSQKRRTSHRG